MPNYDAYSDPDYYRNHGVPTRYDDVFTREERMAMIHYFQFVDGLPQDEAIIKVDNIEKYMRAYAR
jgi:hypothetical protein